MVCALRIKRVTPFLVRKRSVFTPDRDGGVNVDRCGPSTFQFESADPHNYWDRISIVGINMLESYPSLFLTA